MNLRFIKPSHLFYNEVMSSWFKYLYLIFEEREMQDKLVKQWAASEIINPFIAFSLQ